MDGDDFVERALLLTGTIDSSVYNNIGNRITDTETRLSQYESAITKYIEEGLFNPIVFIENSGFNFDKDRFIELTRKNNTKFEYISGTIRKDDVIKYGKSFGDAFLIHEALEKSELLKNEASFYKMSGRIFLRNSNRMTQKTNKCNN